MARTLTVALVLATIFSLSAAAKDKIVAVTITVDSQHSGYEGVRAMDGDPGTMWHTAFGANPPSPPHEITVDLGSSYTIDGIAYLPRSGGGNGTIKAYACYVGDDVKKLGKPIIKGTFARPAAENVVKFPAKTKGRYLRLRALRELRGAPWTSIAELRVLVDGVTFRAKGAGRVTGRKLPPQAVEPAAPINEVEQRFQTLRADLANRKHFDRVGKEVHRPESLLCADDRDPVDIVLRRTAALLKDIQSMQNAPALADEAAKLAELQSAAKTVDIADAEARFGLFEKAHALRKIIAFANPLLDFDKLLFIKRHRSGFNHMCDQYYGINAKPGGGLFVLEDPFSGAPKLRDVLADSVVQRGRLKGTQLNTGSFLSPELSYDGKKIAFAYVESTGSRKHDHHTDKTRGHWDKGQSYHIFTVNVDGTDLAQLTDGTWNDFDPCWMPNGRMVFITERRGGYLRCGRVCPTYTIYDMNDDGSDIRCLSPHETNEWHPSITHDGRIIYTRWDYVDRHGCTAHMPWITSIDGRDSRALHGNFSPRRSRPDMELDFRAIPNSPKYTATAAPHHGQAFGSLILVDPRVADDDGMAPVRRITPEIAFPESQGGRQAYGTAWPLSDDYYLCVYDDTMRRGGGRQGQRHQRGAYGIYLLDAFGNKVLIFRDNAIACQSPMPLRPQPRPFLGPTLAVGARLPAPDVKPAKNAPPAEATMAVINTYESVRNWPKGTKIAALRVYQVLPMSVPSGPRPHETGLRLPTAGDSVNPVRHVLGTVPVEKDGSAYFAVPAHKELFFQALDAKGLAIQSMRSSTYAQGGETLVCAGCHDHRHKAPPRTGKTPLALQRPPSRIKPDVDGSRPFSYPRLVQPVLDKHCVDCHAKPESKTFSLAKEPISRGFYASYNSLTRNYGFWRYGESYRTAPGKFGARASKLHAILTAGHYKVKLSAAEMHRINLWLDSTSLFYGVYEKEAGQAQLRGEIAWPTLE